MGLTSDPLLPSLVSSCSELTCIRDTHAGIVLNLYKECIIQLSIQEVSLRLSFGDYFRIELFIGPSSDNHF